MTIKEIKEQLPEVKVSLAGKIYIAHISGTKLEYPRLHVRELCNASWEVSWKTLAHCITNDKPVIL